MIEGTFLSQEEVIELIKAACEAAGSQAAWGKKLGISGAKISYATTGRHPPCPEILKALKLKRFSVFASTVQAKKPTAARPKAPKPKKTAAAHPKAYKSKKTEE